MRNFSVVFVLLAFREASHDGCSGGSGLLPLRVKVIFAVLHCFASLSAFTFTVISDS